MSATRSGHQALGRAQEDAARTAGPVVEGYGALIAAARHFLDALAAAAPDEGTAALIARDLARVTASLVEQEAAEDARIFGRRPELPAFGQALTPHYVIDSIDDAALESTVHFGNFFLGGRSAAHGGSIPLLFDTLFARLVHRHARVPARTAYLNTDYLAVVPISRPIQARVWVDRLEGRKHFLAGELTCEGVVRSRSRALFVELLPGQP